MKKLLMLTSCIALLMQQANAQYFHRTYGNVTTNETNGQFIPCTPPTVAPFPPSGPGYIMVGRYFDPNAAGAVSELHLVHSNDNGGVPLVAPYFNRHFLLSDRLTTQVCDAWATSVDEIAGTTAGTFDYMVTGTIILPNPYSINFFVLRMTANGTITWIYRYSFPGVIFKEPKLQVDLANANVLVTGRAYDPANPANQQDVFAFSINAATGGINWGQTYDIKPCATCASFDDWGTDIIDNPYTANEALIVGTSSGDGLLLRVSTITGLPVAVVTRYNIPGSVSQILNCINLSANVIGANVTPFIVGGSVQWGAQNDAWTMLIDQTGVVSWSTTHDTGLPGAPLDNTLNEIMERVNTAFQFEYHTAGTVQTTAANSDIQSLKLNAGGFLLAGSEFIYGTAVDQEQGMDIHPSNTGGFGISGNTSIRASDQLRVNAYYNGVTQCNWASANFASVNSPPNTNFPVVNTFSSPVLDTVDTASAPVGMFLICFANAVGGGNNAKVAHNPAPTKEDEGFNFTVLGNGEEGVSTGSDLHIAVQNNSAGNLTARIVDLLGREYACKLNDDGNGRFSISTNIPSTGTYYILLSNGKETKSKTLFVK